MSSDAKTLKFQANSKKLFADPRNFFDPESNPFPPIFPLSPIFNRFYSYGVDIYPIPFYSAAMPNMKAPVANRMLHDAMIAGRLRDIEVLVEASSGNTVGALALLAPYYGIREVAAVIDRDLAQGKLGVLQISGVSQFIHPRKGESTIAAARRLSGQPGWLNLDQYSNPSNWQAHFAYTGPHVFHQTGGKISVFCAALGTTGTVVGVSKFLRGKIPRVTILGAACSAGRDNMVPGARSLDRIQDSFSWKEWVDQVVEVDRYPAYQFSKNLGRTGNLAGVTSGLAWAAVDQFLDKAVGDGTLDHFRNEDGRVVVGFGCGDTALPYLDKYSTVLTGDDLGPIQIS